MVNPALRVPAPPRAEIDAFLQAIELFQDLTPSERDAVAAKLKIVAYDKDAVLFEENQIRENLFLIYQGSVRLQKKSPLGEKKDLARFRRFDFLGEGALMDDYPHATTARTEERTVAFLLSRTAVNELLASETPLVVKILSRTARVISRRMRQATNQVVNAAAQYISGRTRREHDLLGEREVPYEFYYGIQTLRATENFPITGISISQFPDLDRRPGPGQNGRRPGQPGVGAAPGRHRRGHRRGLPGDHRRHGCTRISSWT